MAELSVRVGDITTLDVDTIVNAANASLLGGGGVAGRSIERPDRNCLPNAADLMAAPLATRRSPAVIVYPRAT